jgi:S1-C subfamily serine protease
MVKYRGVWVAIVFLVIASLACSLSAADRNAPREESAAVAVQEVEPLPTPVPTALPESVVIDVDAEDQLLINLYERANPAVVNVDVAANQLGSVSEFGSGSGFVIDKEGHIVTNNHVVESADQVRVTFSDGTVAMAGIVARDEDSDLAVLKVDSEPANLVPLEFGDSSSLHVGQRVIAIGNPWDLGGTMTVGVVSALGRTLPGRITADASYYSIPDLIQTDAAINPGNSGGPLLDSSGRVVGINTAIRSEGRFNAGVGFAIPASIVKRVVPALISEGRYHYPYLGIFVDGDVTLGKLSTELDLPAQRGVLVSTVAPGGPADRAGLQGGDQRVNFLGLDVSIGGDIITKIDDYRLRDFDDLIAYLVRETSVGQQVFLTVLREGEQLEIPLTLGERPN